MMKRIFIANWKMNPDSVDAARLLYRGILRGTAQIKNTEVWIAPPFPFLPLFSNAGRATMGAQDLFWERSGAYTGEVSAGMLKAVGARFVLVGHSERRIHFGETDVVVNKKAKVAIAAGLRAVVCVGERDRGDENFQHAVRSQLIADLFGIQKKQTQKIIVAYEPVWAIGTGKTVTPENLFEMATYIRRILLELFGKRSALHIPILYGGSVTAANAGGFLSVAGINGLLVGGASLYAREFSAIVKSA